MEVPFEFTPSASVASTPFSTNPRVRLKVNAALPAWPGDTTDRIASCSRSIFETTED